MAVECLEHPWACIIGNQLLDGEGSHDLLKSWKPSHKPHVEGEQPGTNHTDESVKQK